MDLSVVVPLHNEEECVSLLHARVEEACAPLGLAFEVVLVDDGSTDRTWELLRGLRAGAGSLVLARLQRRSGQTAAMAAGFELARGEVVVTMDGDLQNDPADIPLLLDKCAEGHDLVCGWRKHRQDKLWTRKIPSRCANWLIRHVTQVRVHDYGCSLKAYRRSLVHRLRLYSDMHRFLPFVSQQVGARVGEVVVRHHPRRFGRTKYGLSRSWKVLADLLALKMLVHYSRRSFLWFVLVAAPLVLAGAGALAAAFVVEVESRTVLFGSGVLLLSFGVGVVFLGLLSDVALQEERAQVERLLLLDARGEVAG